MTNEILKNEQMEARIISAAQNIWRDVAPDLLEAFGEDSICVMEVIQFVPDHLSSRDEQAFNYYMSLDRSDRMKVMRKAFPDSTYGY